MTETTEHVIYTGPTRTSDLPAGKRVRYRKNKQAAAERAFLTVQAAQTKQQTQHAS